MPHVSINSGEPGIRGLFAFGPETAGPMNALADVPPRGGDTLPRAVAAGRVVTHGHGHVPGAGQHR